MQILIRHFGTRPDTAPQQEEAFVPEPACGLTSEQISTELARIADFDTSFLYRAFDGAIQWSLVMLDPDRWIFGVVYKIFPDDGSKPYLATDVYIPVFNWRKTNV